MIFDDVYDTKRLFTKYQSKLFVHCFTINILDAAFQLNLKGNDKPWFNSCSVINVYPLDIPSIQKVTEYRNK